MLCMNRVSSTSSGRTRFTPISRALASWRLLPGSINATVGTSGLAFLNRRMNSPSARSSRFHLLIKELNLFFLRQAAASLARSTVTTLRGSCSSSSFLSLVPTASIFATPTNIWLCLSYVFQMNTETIKRPACQRGKEKKEKF